MSGHGANLIFFNKKKSWTSRTLTNLPPPTSSKISYLPEPPTPHRPPSPPLKMDAICVSPLSKSQVLSLPPTI